MWKVVVAIIGGIVGGMIIGGTIVAIDDSLAIQQFGEEAEQVAKKAYSDGFTKGVQTYKEFITAQE